MGKRLWKAILSSFWIARECLGGSVDLVAEECPAGHTCLTQLTDENFERFVGEKLVSCVVFFEENKAAWKKFQPEFEKLTEATRDHPGIGVAAMKIGGKSDVARATAATGPISVKLFDYRLKVSNFFDLYSFHKNGPVIRLDAHGMTNLLKDYVTNSTGLDTLDEILSGFAQEMLSTNLEAASRLYELANETIANTACPRHQEALSPYLTAMKAVLDKGSLFHIANSFNTLSLELAQSNIYSVDTNTIGPLQDRTRTLLKMHIAGKLASGLLPESSDLPKMKPPTSKEASGKFGSISSSERKEARDKRASEQAEVSLL